MSSQYATSYLDKILTLRQAHPIWVAVLVALINVPIFVASLIFYYGANPKNAYWFLFYFMIAVLFELGGWHNYERFDFDCRCFDGNYLLYFYHSENLVLNVILIFATVENIDEVHFSLALANFKFLLIETLYNNSDLNRWFNWFHNWFVDENYADLKTFLYRIHAIFSATSLSASIIFFLSVSDGNTLQNATFCLLLIKLSLNTTFSLHSAFFFLIVTMSSALYVVNVYEEDKPARAYGRAILCVLYPVNGVKALVTASIVTYYRYCRQRNY